MANPFSGIISTELKQTYNNAIDALLETTALVRTCKFTFDSTESVCNNCIVDTLKKTSTGYYKSGGSIPFTNGQICPNCNGAGLILNENEVSLNLAIIYDMKMLLKFGKSTQYPQGSLLLVSKISTLDTIKQAKGMITDTGLDNSMRLKYKLLEAPTPVGFGASDYLFSIWGLV